MRYSEVMVGFCSWFRKLLLDGFHKDRVTSFDGLAIMVVWVF